MKPAIASVAILALVLAQGCTGSPGSRNTGPPKTTETRTIDRPREKVFAYYYLVWSLRHWRDKLGSEYPLGRDPLPLPARLNENGCNARSKFPGNTLTDVPRRLESQDDPAFLEEEVRTAAGSGLAGFIVNWAGTGAPDQDVDSISYSLRLEGIVDAVKELNSEGADFKLMLQYKASARPRSLDHIIGDWTYLARRYENNSAFDRSLSGKTIVIWAGSRKYEEDLIRAVANRFRDTFTIIGDENWRTWTPSRGALLDGNTYYWSSQNPYTNEDSFDQLIDLARTVRSSATGGPRKLWFAPLTPGYNSELAGGTTCVPRKDGETLRRIFEGNARSKPDAWTLISWNELAEGTYVQPLQRWGDRYLSQLTDIVMGP